MESQGASSPAILYAVPGVSLMATSSGNPGRGAFAESDRYFAVEGTSLIEVDEAWNITVRGTVAADSNPATIASNGDGGGQLFITSGSNGYCYDLGTNTLTQVAALNGKATMCGFLDGYFLVLDKSTSSLYHSDLLDGLTWNPGVDFAQRTRGSDKWVAMKINGIYIGLFGERTSEYWYDAGTSSFPFAPYPSLLIPHGCAATFTAAVGEGHAFRLAQSSIGHRYVVHSTGFAEEVVSDLPRQRIFSGYGDVSDATGELLNRRGHLFYRIHFPVADATWVYDLTMNKWFEWGTWISEESAFAMSRWRWPVVVFGEIRALDSETGDMYVLSDDVHKDVDDRELVWERQAPGLTNEGERVYYDSLELAVERGVGNSDDPNPQVMMQRSDDGGRTWSQEFWRPMGAQGEYTTQLRWDREGSSRDRVYKVRGSAAVVTVLVDAFLEGSVNGRRFGA